MLKKSYLMSRRQFLVNGVIAGTGTALAARGLDFGLFSSKSSVSASDRLRVAFIGLGQYGLLQLMQCAALPAIEICALCDKNESLLSRRLLDCKDLWKRVPEAVTSYQRLLDRKDIDAVSVAVPPGLRAEIVRYAHQSGKHVYIAPPWAETVKESLSLIQTTNASRNVVWQGAADPAWDSDALAAIVQADCGTRVRDLRVTAYRGPEEYSSNSVGDAISLQWLYAVDLFEMARLILKVDNPTRVSTAGGFLSPTRTTNSVSARLDFDSGDGQRKSLITQMFAKPMWKTGQVVIEITATTDDGETRRYLIESTDSGITNETAWQQAAGWGLFQRYLSTGQKSWSAEPAQRAHFASIYLLSSEHSLQTGRPLFYSDLANV